jgi:hypothetical protein
MVNFLVVMQQQSGNYPNNRVSVVQKNEFAITAGVNLKNNSHPSITSGPSITN